ncbi:MAG: hypothetical protein GY754_23695, partial [bacterium]|nr:hypothetical protein [bacterium]
MCKNCHYNNLIGEFFHPHIETFDELVEKSKRKNIRLKCPKCEAYDYTGIEVTNEGLYYDENLDNFDLYEEDEAVLESKKRGNKKLMIYMHGPIIGRVIVVSSNLWTFFK